VIRFEQRGPVALVTIDRPERRNAVDHEALQRLTESIERATTAVPATRVLVLTGEGGHFCAGADLTGLEDAGFASVLRGVLERLRDAVTPEHLVISIAAGVSLGTILQRLGHDRRLARGMPNTPALIGEGASGFCLGPNARPSDEALVLSCLNSVGRAYRVPESLLDAVTGLSGSGPAFVYLMIEALSDGGVRVGLPRDVATALAAQTILGAARMVLETGQHPGQLKDQVTSPGGTTIAGLHALERGGLRATLIDAVVAATARSAELAAQAAGSTPPPPTEKRQARR